MYTFDVALNDVDRGVYETLNIKAACHPSEAEDYFAKSKLDDLALALKPS